MRYCGLCGTSLSSNEDTVMTELPMVGLALAIRLGFTNYFRFSGIARRSEYSWWMLFSTLIGMIPLVGWLIGITLWIQRISLTTRRLHGIGKSGWWQLWLILVAIAPWLIVITRLKAGSLVSQIWILLISINIGLAIMFVVWMTRKGDEGPNKYGPDPRRPVAYR